MEIITYYRMIELFPVCCILVLGITAVLLAPFGVYLEFDPFFFMFQIFLPRLHENACCTLETAFVVGVRFVLSFICVAETTRVICFTATIGLSLIGLAKSCLNTIAECDYTSQFHIGNIVESMKIYDRLTIDLKQVSPCINTLLGVYLLFLHFLIVLQGWLSFKVYNFVPIYIYMFSPIWLILAVGGTIVMVTELVHIRELSCKIVKDWTCFGYGFKMPSYIKLKTKASRPIYFRCMDFFVPKRSTRMSFLKITTDNLMSALLLAPLNHTLHKEK